MNDSRVLPEALPGTSRRWSGSGEFAAVHYSWVGPSGIPVGRSFGTDCALLPHSRTSFCPSPGIRAREAAPQGLGLDFRGSDSKGWPVWEPKGRGIVALYGASARALRGGCQSADLSGYPRRSRNDLKKTALSTT